MGGDANFVDNISYFLNIFIFFILGDTVFTEEETVLGTGAFSLPG